MGAHSYHQKPAEWHRRSNTLQSWEEPLPTAPSLHPTGPHNSEVLGVLTCEPPHLWELLWPPFEMNIIYNLKWINIPESCVVRFKKKPMALSVPLARLKEDNPSCLLWEINTLLYIQTLNRCCFPPLGAVKWAPCDVGTCRKPTRRHDLFHTQLQKMTIYGIANAKFNYMERALEDLVFPE